LALLRTSSTDNRFACEETNIVPPQRGIIVAQLCADQAGETFNDCAQLPPASNAARSCMDVMEERWVTNSTISLGALKRILGAIPIALSEFFSLELEKADSPFHRAGNLVEIGKGAIS